MLLHRVQYFRDREPVPALHHFDPLGNVAALCQAQRQRQAIE